MLLVQASRSYDSQPVNDSTCLTDSDCGDVLECTVTPPEMDSKLMHLSCWYLIFFFFFQPPGSTAVICWERFIVSCVNFPDYCAISIKSPTSSLKILLRC